MKIRTLARRGTAAAALSALVAAGLASAPAPAHATLNDGTNSVEAGFDGFGPTCTYAGGTPSPAPVSWTDNGVAVSSSTSTSGTVTGGTPADVTHLSASAYASIAATRIGSGSATINAALKLSAEASPAPTDTTCNGQALADVDIEGYFELTEPRWATITASSSGTGRDADLEVQLYTADGTVELQVNRRGHGSVSALLPAGEVELSIEGDVYTDATASDPAGRRAALDGKVTIDLQPVGLASAATGKGQAYAQLGTRACPAGTVGVGITKKAARQAKSVQVTVNGRKAVTLKGKKLKKRALVLPAAASSRADVAARITLKNGKVVDVRRSYLACS